MDEFNRYELMMEALAELKPEIEASIKLQTGKKLSQNKLCHLSLKF